MLKNWKNAGRKPNFPCGSVQLVRSQRFNWIDSGRAASRQIACQRSRGGQDERHSEERQGINRQVEGINYFADTLLVCRKRFSHLLARRHSGIKNAACQPVLRNRTRRYASTRASFCSSSSSVQASRLIIELVIFFRQGCKRKGRPLPPESRRPLCRRPPLPWYVFKGGASCSGQNPTDNSFGQTKLSVMSNTSRKDALGDKSISLISLRV